MAQANHERVLWAVIPAGWPNRGPEWPAFLERGGCSPSWTRRPLSVCPGPCAAPLATGATAQGTRHHHSPSPCANGGPSDSQPRRRRPEAWQERRQGASDPGRGGGGMELTGVLGRPPRHAQALKTLSTLPLAPKSGDHEDRRHTGGNAAGWKSADDTGHCNGTGSLSGLCSPTVIYLLLALLQRRPKQFFVVKSSPKL